jgi:hypothetical protein
LDDGEYIEFRVEQFRFGCAFQKLKEAVKVTFYFYDCFSEDEQKYWFNKGYLFRLGSTEAEYNQTLAVMRLRNLQNDLPIKVIMFKQMDTLLKFKRNFKYIAGMLRNRHYVGTNWMLE